jgi:hypothetical protein
MPLLNETQKYKIIAASNRDLRLEVSARRFRQDLYSALASFLLTYHRCGSAWRTSLRLRAQGQVTSDGGSDVGEYCSGT